MSETQPTDAELRKALLLCAHAEELSAQCVIAIRHEMMDGLLEIQTRKSAIVAELATTLRALEVASFPELQQAVERLRAGLRTETSLLSTASDNLHEEAARVKTAQTRLTQARRYDTAALSSPSEGGGQFSFCG